MVKIVIETPFICFKYRDSSQINGLFSLALLVFCYKTSPSKLTLLTTQYVNNITNMIVISKIRLQLI